MTTIQGTKRIRCAFTLDTQGNASHRHALAALSDCLQQLPSDYGVRDTAIDQLNQQIYLSGLFLHLLSPQLTQSLTRQFAPDQITVETLAAQLTQFQLAPRPVPGAESNLAQEMDQLRDWLTERLANITVPSPPSAPAPGKTTISNIEADNSPLAGLGSSPVQTEAMTEELVSETIKKVARIKAKGLW